MFYFFPFRAAFFSPGRLVLSLSLSLPLSFSPSLSLPIKFFFFHPSLFSPAPARALPHSRMAEETVVVAEAVAAVPAEGGAEGAETVVVVGKRRERERERLH